VALFLNSSRQRYALRAAHCAFGVARGLVGLTADQEIASGVGADTHVSEVVAKPLPVKNSYR
jgi:hypothetical protein